MCVSIILTKEGKNIIKLRGKIINFEHIVDILQWMRKRRQRINLSSQDCSRNKLELVPLVPTQAHWWMKKLIMKKLCYVSTRDRDS
jgi:hypothetical protein